MDPRTTARRVAQGQALFWLLSGVWPLVHMRSFQAVTGPKRDGWLVRTVGALIALIAATLALGARREQVPVEVALLGAGGAAALAAVDVGRVAVGRISPVYLLDAALEPPIAWGWWRAWRAGGLAPLTPRRARG